MDDLHIENGLPVSAAEGWMQMQSLLNKNLPVKKEMNTVSRLLSFLPAIFLSGIFLFSSLQLDNHLFHIPFFGSKPLLGANTTLVTSALLPVIAKQQKALDNSFTTSRLNKVNLPYEIYVSPDEEEMISTMATERVRNLHYINDILENKTRINLPVKAITLSGNNINNNLLTGEPKNKLALKSWGLSAGIAMNIAAGKQQDLQPYPVAEVRYQISQRFFIAGGLSLLSPVAGNVSGISKTVYVNDTVNNISLYNEIEKHDRLRYADVPLTVGMNINKKLTLQAGMQVSVLMNKRKTTSLQPYDFQMNNISLPDTSPLVGMAANPQQEFDVRMRNTDYRFIAGLRYQFNRASAGLFYQHRLQSTGTGSSKSTTPGNLVTLNLSWKIK